MYTQRTIRLLTLFTSFLCMAVMAADVPLVLPRPDGKPGDMSKPLKVYILAGQSNMVGFGVMSGARPRYPAIYLSADPSVIPGSLAVGQWNIRGLRAHGLYQAASGDETGAKVAVYAGAYDPNADYSKKTPARQAVVPLGSATATLPSIDGPHTIVARAFIEVPETGTYSVHAGYKESSYCVAALNGKEVYRKDLGKAPVIEKINLEAGKRHPLTITYQKGGSCAFWLAQTGLKGKGDLTTLTKEGKFPWLVDAEGKWTSRKDVIYREVRCSQEELGRGGPLSVTSNGKFIGPEVPFGYVMGTFHDETVLLIESSMGNRALCFDFRPPSSGRPNPDSQWEGAEWRHMVEGVRKTLDNLDKVVPGYKGQGYEIVGFVWWQGHKDRGRSRKEYEENLVNLIQDLRKEFKVPDMRAVVATVGFGGWNMHPDYLKILEAQMAVGDPEQHPEFAGKVASVDIRGFWRSWDDSPNGGGPHYNGNAETYMLTGDALGRAMVELLGGKVEMPPKPVPPKKKEVTKPEPTAEELAAHRKAVEPMVIDGMLEEYLDQVLNNTRKKAALAAAIKGERSSARGQYSQYLRDSIDDINQFYSTAGITDYNWHDFGPDVKHASWDYFSFDPPEQKKDRSRGASYRKVTMPKGMEHWFAPDFDAKAAGWKTGAAPFGQKDGKMVALKSCPDESECRCGVTPKTLWEKEVLLLRKTIEVPKLKEGHRYRIVIGGGDHVQGGDGYDLYVNGRLLASSPVGVAKRHGGQPRGGHIYGDFRKTFGGQKVTIAFMSFLRYNDPRVPKDYPPNGHVSIWIEEQKLPPLPDMGEVVGPR